MVKRIKQYEKFIENCERYKEFEKLKQQNDLVVLRRNSMVDGMDRDPIQKVIKRSRSLSPFPQDEEYKEAKERGCYSYSLPELPEADTIFDLEEKILIWQSCGGPYLKKGWIKATSLTALVEETEEEEEETISIKSKRRSKSIDSYITCTWG